MNLKDTPLCNILDESIINYCYKEYNVNDVKKSLLKDTLSLYDFGVLLSPAADAYLNEMAIRSYKETKKQFGNMIQIYTPLYIANYCVNECVYCGYNIHNKIERAKLSPNELYREFQTISKLGLQEILLLSGEDRNNTSIEYIGQAIKSASNFFSTIGIEIYPLDVDEYSYLHRQGADFVSIYQETYSKDNYAKCHLSGPKTDYLYRLNAHERAIQGGIRGVTFGSLLGLGDFRNDIFATGCHAYLIQMKYPHTEISLSVPRLRSFLNCKSLNKLPTTERHLLQTMLALRIFLPFATINISTREKSIFRDNVIGLVANKISAEVKTSVGGHSEKKGDEQFYISDKRSVNEIHNAIIRKGLQPVYSNHIRI